MLFDIACIRRRIYSGFARILCSPQTGIIEDSGGESNAALGQSMVEGVVESVGLLETDLDENQYLAFTFNLMDSISDVAIQTQGATSDDWNDVAFEIVAEGNDNKSFLIPVPTQSTIFRVSLFVKPMGRSVLFFMGAGNTTGIPATKQNVSGSAPTGGGTTTSTGLGDVQGLILSDTVALPESVMEFFADEFEAYDIWKHFPAVQEGRVFDLPYELFGMSATFDYQDGVTHVAEIFYGEDFLS